MGGGFNLWAGMMEGGGVLSALLAACVHASAVVVPVR
jgi:hypothetical protein